MAYDRYHDDETSSRDDRRHQGERMHDDREWRESRQYRDRDDPRDRGMFRGERDDRDPASRRDDRHDPRARDRQRDPSRPPVPTDETPDLISSSKVEGTPVYGRDDERLGTIRSLMIDKVEGQVRYAVLAHASGFLGLDAQLFPVRWDELRYDERRNGYRVGFTAEDVRYTLERRQRQGSGRARDIDREWRR